MPMLPDGEGFYTVAEIACSLGVSRVRATQLLGGALTHGQKLVRDRRYADAYATADFPRKLRERLAVLARKAGCRSIAHFIESKCVPWQPELPLAEICDEQTGAATARRNILASLLRAHVDSLAQRKIAELALDAFSRHAPQSLPSDRTVRFWIARAAKRDNGREEWERVELYLDDKLRRRGTANAENCQSLYFDSWPECLHFLATEIANGVPENVAKAELRKRIKGTPLVGDLDAHGIFVAMDRNWQRWECEHKLSDKRKGKAGRFAKFQLSVEEKNALRALHLKKESFALAVEEFAESPECQPATRALIFAELDRAARLRRRPQWPLSLRQAAHVTQEIKAYFRGKKAFTNLEPCQRRGMFWEDKAGEKIPMAPNTIWESDDMSINEPFSYRDPESGEWRLGRQMLCTLDLYSCAWLGVQPVGRPRDAYRLEDIADHLLECVLENGLPIFWKFERGSWENTVIDGIKLADGTRWGELDKLCTIKREFKAKGKGTIESSFNLLQKMLAHKSTTIGRIRGEFEDATQLFLKAQQSGDVRYAAKFWEISACADGVAEAMQRFNLRQKQRHGFGRQMVVPADISHSAVKRECPPDELWRFCPIKREATVRRGFIHVSVDHYPNPFRFWVNGVDGERYFENGLKVLIAFHPGRPQDGCHVFNAERGSRNRDNIPFGAKLLVAPMDEDAPQVSLVKRKKSNPVVRTEFRSIVPTGKVGSRISVARDGRGFSFRREEGRAPADSQQRSKLSRTDSGDDLIERAMRAQREKPFDEAAEMRRIKEVTFRLLDEGRLLWGEYNFAPGEEEEYRQWQATHSKA